MVKIVINGYAGRMGREIISGLKLSHKFNIVGGIDLKITEKDEVFKVTHNPSDVVPLTDIVIDFSLPEGALKILESCVTYGKALVTGTTGLDKEQLRVFKQAAEKIPIVQAFNFSIGINLLNQLVKQTVAVLGDLADIEIVEHHHRHKKDAPSGTAVMLAKTITESLGRSYDESLKFGRYGADSAREKEIGIHSIRGGSVIGEHQIFFLGDNENLVLVHQAQNRKLFVTGVLKAIEWVWKKPAGLYSMKEVLGF
jgi:4-hydroxy-tetrahydrodipicolinate reductase